MTATTTDGIRALYNKATDENDRAILGALLGCQQSHEAAAELADAMAECASCGYTCVALELDAEGNCEECQARRALMICW